MSIVKRFRLVLCALFLGVASVLPAVAQERSPERAPENYILRPKDSISITIFNEGDLSTAQMLDSDGKVILPLVGPIRLAGMTTRQAERAVAQLYIEEEILVSPHVTVRLTAYAELQFYIFGEVRSPGVKTFPVGTTSLDILQVISMAGSFTELARPNNVRVTRVAEDGTETTFTIDAERLMRGTASEAASKVRILPEDRIFVPQRFL